MKYIKLFAHFRKESARNLSAASEGPMTSHVPIAESRVQKVTERMMGRLLALALAHPLILPHQENRSSGKKGGSLV